MGKRLLVVVVLVELGITSPGVIAALRLCRHIILHRKPRYDRVRCGDFWIGCSNSWRTQALTRKPRKYRKLAGFSLQGEAMIKEGVSNWAQNSFL